MSEPAPKGASLWNQSTDLVGKLPGLYFTQIEVLDNVTTGWMVWDKSQVPFHYPDYNTVYGVVELLPPGIHRHPFLAPVETVIQAMGNPVKKRKVEGGKAIYDYAPAAISGAQMELRQQAIQTCLGRITKFCLVDDLSEDKSGSEERYTISSCRDNPLTHALVNLRLAEYAGVDKEPYTDIVRQMERQQAEPLIETQTFSWLKPRVGKRSTE